MVDGKIHAHRFDPVTYKAFTDLLPRLGIKYTEDGLDQALREYITIHKPEALCPVNLTMTLAPAPNKQSEVARRLKLTHTKGPLRQTLSNLQFCCHKITLILNLHPGWVEITSLRQEFSRLDDVVNKRALTIDLQKQLPKAVDILLKYSDPELEKMLTAAEQYLNDFDRLKQLLAKTFLNYKYVDPELGKLLVTMEQYLKDGIIGGDTRNAPA